MQQHQSNAIYGGLASSNASQPSNGRLHDIFDSNFDMTNSQHLASNSDSSTRQFMQLSADQLFASQLAASQHQNSANLAHANVPLMHHNNDASLYSPSSSASLIYHTYDQINPQPPQSMAQLDAQSFNKQTTVLNPSNLFSQSPFVMTSKWPQKACFPSSASAHTIMHGQMQQQHQPMSRLSVQPYASGQLMNAARHPTNKPTMARNIQHPQHSPQVPLVSGSHFVSTLATRHLNYPPPQAGVQSQLQSASSASSLSNPSTQLTYGRQLRRDLNTQAHSLHGLHSSLGDSTGTSKSSCGLASVLCAGLDLKSAGQPRMGVSPSLKHRLARKAQRLRKFSHEYKSLVNYLLVLVIVCGALVLSVRFGSISNGSNHHNSATQQISPHQLNGFLSQQNPQQFDFLQPPSNTQTLNKDIHLTQPQNMHGKFPLFFCASLVLL